LANNRDTRHRGRQLAAGRPRPRVTLDQLHTFVAVADAEHVGAAADALHLSQGSVSAAIRRLEDGLGLPLLHRVGRNVRLTDIGRAVRQLAIRTLDEAAQVERLAGGYSAFERGEITIASGRVTGAYLLGGWLSPFVSRHPDVDLRLQLVPATSLLEMLRSGAADIVIAGTSLREAGIETIVLETSELLIVVAPQHPLASSTSPMSELRRHRYLAHESGTATQARALGLLGHASEALTTIALEEMALHAALLAGIGFAVMPRSAVRREIEAKQLVVVPRGGRSIRQQFTAARRRGLQTPAAQALWEQLASNAAPR
jgi:DNA-binding transcriptional LysR family regulator